MSQYQPEHKTYFDSLAGEELLTSINNMLDSNHQKAENIPENARDYMQRAKGNREVLDMINSLLAEMRKPES